MSSLTGQPERYPAPNYLLGALIEDDVAPDLAMRIAKGYSEARQRLNADGLHLWLNSMLHELCDRHGGLAASTAMTVFAYPSTHSAERYERLAQSASNGREV